MRTTTTRASLAEADEDDDDGSLSSPPGSLHQSQRYSPHQYRVLIYISCAPSRRAPCPRRRELTSSPSSPRPLLSARLVALALASHRVRRRALQGHPRHAGLRVDRARRGRVAQGPQAPQERLVAQRRARQLHRRRYHRCALGPALGLLRLPAAFDETDKACSSARRTSRSRRTRATAASSRCVHSLCSLSLLVARILADALPLDALQCMFMESLSREVDFFDFSQRNMP